MSVPINSLREGQCYITTEMQVRRVLKISGDILEYEARGKKNIPLPWGPKISVSVEKFAESVDRLVTCDWDAEYPERKI